MQRLHAHAGCVSTRFRRFLLLQAQTGFDGGAQELVGFGLKGHGLKLGIKFAAVNLSERPDVERGIQATAGTEVFSGLKGAEVQAPQRRHSEGSFTIVSQKSSIVFTTLMNWSRSTGLVI